ncbi:MAG: hypothetical protein QXL91_04480 [Candidatus Bathyarchaeia archaeon]
MKTIFQPKTVHPNTISTNRGKYEFYAKTENSISSKRHPRGMKLLSWTRLKSESFFPRKKGFTAVLLPSLSLPLNAFRLWLLTVAFYMLIELFQFAATAILLGDWRELRRAVMPLTVMAYRLLHSMVRLAAYMMAVFKRKVGW